MTRQAIFHPAQGYRGILVDPAENAAAPHVGVTIGPAPCIACSQPVWYGTRTVGRGNTARIKMWRNATGRPHKCKASNRADREK